MIGAFYNASDLRVLGYFSHNGENLPCKHHSYLVFQDTFYSLAVIVIVTVEPAFSLAGLDPFLFPDVPGQPLGFVLKIFSKRQERKCFSSAADMMAAQGSKAGQDLLFLADIIVKFFIILK